MSLFEKQFQLISIENNFNKLSEKKNILYQPKNTLTKKTLVIRKKNLITMTIKISHNQFQSTFVEKNC